MSFLGAQNSIALGVQGIIAIDTGTGTIAVVTDPYWPYVSMLLHGDSPQQFNQDASTNVFPITAVGAVQASTRTPFTGGPSSYGSGYFGGSGNYLSLTANAAFTIPVSTSFTIEAWIYLSNVGANQTICANPGYASGYSFRYNAGSGLGFRSDATLLDISQGSTTGWVANTWYHVAVVRNGASAITIYRNGVSIATGTSVASFGTGELDVGGSVADGVYLTGYISNFRLVNGTAVYTSAFTPPTTQLTAVTNTALLTLQTNVPQNNNQFFDTSTNNFTVTRNGNTTQGSFNPFVSTYPYSVATNGGSAYFDGTGDYLTVPDNDAFNLAANDFTVECWAYFNSTAGNIYFAGQSYSGGSNFSFSMTRTTAGELRCVASTPFNLSSVSSAGALNTGLWYHIVYTRDGNTIRQYINGVQNGTANSTGVTISNSTGVFGVGSFGDDNPTQLLNGYISNFRLVNGTCLYPSGTTFTPPTAPLTAVTNTALLLGMSNGAIYDNAELNNLETVANAQISTSTFKYGTGSVALNGTTDVALTPAKTAFTLGSGDFTVECWINQIAVKNAYIAGQGDTTSTTANTPWFMYINTSRLPQIGVNTNGGYWNATSSTAVTLNTWTHIAAVRDGATLRIYVNGVQTGTSALIYTLNTSSSNLGIGNAGDSTSLYFNGYIDDFRFTKGICRYPSGTTFPPPTAAFPNS